LQAFSAGADNGRLHAVFAVAIGDDGPLKVVYVEPDDRESLIIAINEELTSMLGSPHHVISTDKLEAFLARHQITGEDLREFKDTYEK
jgi:hypothetical protein